MYSTVVLCFSLRLQTGGRRDGAPDNCGFGVFLGNTKFKFQQFQSGDGWGGWSASTKGYLPQQVIAYALASIEFRRGNESPMWINFLKKDFKSDFRKCMLFLLEQ